MRLSKHLRILKRTFGRGVFPHQMSWMLDLPGRGLIMPAKTVANRLPIEPGASVLEVGPGSGYYSVAVAKRIPRGHLSLVDVQQNMLDKTAKRLDRANISNFSTYLSDGQSLPFDKAVFDAIFLVAVFGEIESRDAFLRESRRILKPGGVLSITEHHPDPDFERSVTLINTVSPYGFFPLQILGWRWAYTLNFRTEAG